MAAYCNAVPTCLFECRSQWAGILKCPTPHLVFTLSQQARGASGSAVGHTTLTLPIDSALQEYLHD